MINRFVSVAIVAVISSLCTIYTLKLSSVNDKINRCISERGVAIATSRDVVCFKQGMEVAK